MNSYKTGNSKSSAHIFSWFLFFIFFCIHVTCSSLNQMALFPCSARLSKVSCAWSVGRHFPNKPSLSGVEDVVGILRGPSWIIGVVEPCPPLGCTGLGWKGYLPPNRLSFPEFSLISTSSLIEADMYSGLIPDLSDFHRVVFVHVTISVSFHVTRRLLRGYSDSVNF